MGKHQIHLSISFWAIIYYIQQNVEQLIDFTDTLRSHKSGLDNIYRHWQRQMVATLV